MKHRKNKKPSHKDIELVLDSLTRNSNISITSDILSTVIDVSRKESIPAGMTLKDWCKNILNRLNINNAPTQEEDIVESEAAIVISSVEEAKEMTATTVEKPEFGINKILLVNRQRVIKNEVYEFSKYYDILNMTPEEIIDEFMIFNKNGDNTLENDDEIDFLVEYLFGKDGIYYMHLCVQDMNGNSINDLKIDPTETYYIPASGLPIHPWGITNLITLSEEE